MIHPGVMVDALTKLQTALLHNWTKKLPVIKIFNGTAGVVYFYESKSTDARYAVKERYESNISDEMLQDMMATLTSCIGDYPKIKYATLSKNTSGFRLRFNVEEYPDIDTKSEINTLFALAILKYKYSSANDAPQTPVSTYTGNTCTPKTERKNKMNDFSLTNLKDALVDKVTNLDKKTISILAIIALVLLVVGKYNTIKGLVVGIKDKVTGSDDFKAMVADGTKAIDSLKKIVGVKPDTKAKKGKE